MRDHWATRAGPIATTQERQAEQGKEADGAKLSPRRVPDHHQLSLDDERLRHVEALVRLVLREGHDTQHVTSAGGLDAPAASNVVGP